MSEMTTETDTEKMAQALRVIRQHLAADPSALAASIIATCDEALLVHESRAQPAKPDGYAYRYADGFLRFNQGAPVNGGKPIEAIPFYFAPPPAQPASVAADGLALIAIERRRQVEEEGWTQEHDDEHSNYELAEAACCYANPGQGGPYAHPTPGIAPLKWPWSPLWWKPSKDPVRNLVKAGALIVAEIDRLLRAKVAMQESPDE